MHIHVNMHWNTSIRINTRTHDYMHAHMRTDCGLICLYIYSFVYVRMSVCIYTVCDHIYMCIHISVCTHACLIFACVCTHMYAGEHVPHLLSKMISSWLLHNFLSDLGWVCAYMDINNCKTHTHALMHVHMCTYIPAHLRYYVHLCTIAWL